MKCFMQNLCFMQVLFYLIPLFLQEDVLGPPPDNEDVVNDFDIEEEVVEVENR